MFVKWNKMRKKNFSETWHQKGYITLYISNKTSHLAHVLRKEQCTEKETHSTRIWEFTYVTEHYLYYIQHAVPMSITIN